MAIREDPAPAAGAKTGAYPALRGLRIGCVQYLNARPLIHGYDGPVRFDHPAQLARDMAAGRLDAALVPIFEALGERQYPLVDDVAIASDGPVYSVFLAFRGEVSAIRRVALDPASLTSVHLLQVLLAEYHGARPQCVGAEEEADARLLIGNQAIEYRQQAHAEEVRFLDLGEEWSRCTGLPFVYALWVLREGAAALEQVAEDFRALKRAGVARIEEIVRSEAGRPPEFVRRYLGGHIRFDLGAREKEGIEKFRALLVKHGFLRGSDWGLRFV